VEGQSEQALLEVADIEKTWQRHFVVQERPHGTIDDQWIDK
jgi:hypothetical protein